MHKNGGRLAEGFVPAGAPLATLKAAVKRRDMGKRDEAQSRSQPRRELDALYAYLTRAA